uniref:Transthyretin-like family protein n=1 Tax=Panagrellus redivivus TaxID=6233 RepID=A0A7E4VUY8_PANRE
MKFLILILLCCVATVNSEWVMKIVARVFCMGTGVTTNVDIMATGWPWSHKSQSYYMIMGNIDQHFWLSTTPVLQDKRQPIFLRFYAPCGCGDYHDTELSPVDKIYETQEEAEQDPWVFFLHLENYCKK